LLYSRGLQSIYSVCCLGFPGKAIDFSHKRAKGCLMSPQISKAREETGLHFQILQFWLNYIFLFIGMKFGCHMPEQIYGVVVLPWHCKWCGLFEFEPTVFCCSDEISLCKDFFSVLVNIVMYITFVDYMRISIGIWMVVTEIRFAVSIQFYLG